VTRIKRSTLAGTWYAADKSRLREQVDGLLRAAQPASPMASLIGLVVPHAGYAYSGRAAAAGYACLTFATYQRAVILAPSHFASFRGAALLDVDGFETPLGTVAVDRDGLAALLHQPLFREDAAPYREEHALEIQLPFLQCVAPKARVVPVLLGGLTAGDYATVADALRALAAPDTVYVVSSDFVHYGWRFDYQPFPPAGAEEVRGGLRALDMGAIEYVCAGDAAGFQRYVADTGATICGRMPIAVFLTLHGRRTPGQLLTYYTSLDVTQDYEHCVSYASIAFPHAA
jgi:AmmeMemoRadiSam system protein B